MSPSIRRTRAGAAAVALAILLLPAPVRAQADEPAPAEAAPAPRPEIWHAQAITQSIAGPSITYYWSKGRSLRAQTTLRGVPVLTLVHRDWYYVINEIEGTGLAVQRSTRALQDDALGQRPFAREADLIIEQGAERVRTETFGGGKADVYRLTDRVSKREVWIPSEGVRVPLMVEVFDRSIKQTRRTQYVGWTQELDIPDTFFAPDPRIRMERLTYAEYLERSAKGPVGKLPVLFGALLHGIRPE